MRNVGINLGSSTLGKSFKTMFSSRSYNLGLTSEQKKQLNSQLSNVTLNPIISSSILSASQNSVNANANVYSFMNIQTTEENNCITITFSGSLEDITVGGTFTLNKNLLNLISKPCYHKMASFSTEEKTSMCNLYGIVYQSDQDLWNSYLVFIYMYMSIMVSSSLYEENKLNLKLPKGLKTSFFLLPESLISFSTNTIPFAASILSSDTRQILSLSYGNFWPFYMYENPKVLSQIISNMTNAKIINRIISGSS